MTVLFKLGGSLLTLAGLPENLRAAVSERQQQEPCLILTGGGATADVVRDWSRVHQLPDETAHWLAIASLDLNRQLLESLLSWHSISTRAEFRRMTQRTPIPLLLDFNTFVKAEEPLANRPLPHNWDVTTDSLAAWTALCWPARELVLLKSVPIPAGLTARAASEQDLVDPYFPQLAQDLECISWCNLRHEPRVIQPWLKRGIPQAK
ncbi:MAG: hypothetical protein DWI02_07515 [Planctomycetota bacterium]|nr:MAG: hypothetical protein DWI02_07515 [Planctomycetota bacterium]